jgi:hypothetical protein
MIFSDAKVADVKSKIVSKLSSDGWLQGLFLHHHEITIELPAFTDDNHILQ